MLKALKMCGVTNLNKSWFCPYLQKFRRRDYIYYYKKFCGTEKVDPNKVLMLSDSRESLGGNLEFLDKELKRQGFEVVYFFKKTLRDKKTRSEKIELSRMMAQSKFIVLDDFYPLIYPIPLRKETKLIQVWHAMGAFKKVGFSRVGKPGGPNPRSLSHKNYSATIVSSDKIRENYAEAFGIAVEKVYATGVPRTDIFFDSKYKEDVRKELEMKYPQIIGKKVVLFAPTFRGNGQNTAHYNFDILDFEKIKRVLGPEYCFVFKLHPFVKNTEQLPEDDDFFLNLSGEREINDLLFITDVLITDYSSVIFEAALLNLDTVFFVPDLEEYMASRDFYYPFEEYMYGKMAENEEELLDAIKCPTNDSKKCAEFKEKFCGACDGKSTERVVEKLFVGEKRE